MFHTEHCLLSLAKNQKGVVQTHGMFHQTKEEIVINETGDESMKKVRRAYLVLDCFVGHDFSQKHSNITNMHDTVIKEMKIPEHKAIRIFYKVVKIVENLHQLNIVHGDLKLGNIIWDKRSGDITLANFILGKHITSQNDLLNDQRGSPAYMSPDVISRKPYLPLPADMWALGIVLYTMLVGHFPLYDQTMGKLFEKISLGQFTIPRDVLISQQTVELKQSLLALDPSKRPSASEVVEMVRSIIEPIYSLMWDVDLQVVPESQPGPARPTGPTYFESCLLDWTFADILTGSEELEEDSEPPKKKANIESQRMLASLRSHNKVGTQVMSAGKHFAQMVSEKLKNQRSPSSTNDI